MKKIEDYVSYEQAARLKAAGFDEPCEMFYTDAVKIPCSELRPYAYAKRKNWNKTSDKESAVPLWQAQKWLREEKRISVRVNYMPGSSRWFADWLHLDSGEYGDAATSFDTYEEALRDGIDAALQLVGRE